MNTDIPSNGTKRTLVLMIAAGALAFSACGSADEPPATAPAAEETPSWSFSPYPHRVDVPEGTSGDGRSTRAPRAMGGHVPAPTV